jgi:hypothetical protein
VAPTTTTVAPTTTTVAPTTTTVAPTTTTAAVNLLPNPSFEEAGTPSNVWGGKAARSTASAHAGNYGLAQTTSSSSGGWDLRANRAMHAPIVAGRTYSLTMWVKASKPLKMTLYAELFSSNGSFRASPGSPRVTIPANTWTSISVTFTASSNHAFVGPSPNFSAASSGTVISYDDMRVFAA